MARSRIIIYQDGRGKAPLLEWLEEELQEKERIKLQAKIDLLAEQGHALRRPHCDLLDEKIYELRFRKGHKNFRVLYFFWGTIAVVLSHGLVKVGKIPKAEIQRALRYKARFMAEPDKHTYRAAGR